MPSAGQKSSPTAKDSLSMQTRWSDAGEERAVTAPVSLIGVLGLPGM